MNNIVQSKRVLDDLDGLSLAGFVGSFRGTVSDGEFWDGKVLTEEENAASIANQLANAAKEEAYQTRKREQRLSEEKSILEKAYEESMGFLWKVAQPAAKVLNDVGGNFNNGSIATAEVAAEISSVVYDGVSGFLEHWKLFLIGFLFAFIIVIKI